MIYIYLNFKNLLRFKNIYLKINYKNLCNLIIAKVILLLKITIKVKLD